MQGPQGDVGAATVSAAQLVAASDVSGVTNEVISFADDGEFKIMALDLSAVGQVSSLFLGTLMRLNKHLAERGAVLRLCGLQGGVSTAIRASLIDKIIDVFEDMDSAIRD